MRRDILLSAAALLAISVLSAKEERVAPGNLPAPVLKAVEARFRGLPITGAGKETEDGKPVYEVTLDDKGMTIDATLTPEGSLVKIEREIGRAALPKPVGQAIERRYPKAAWRIVEEITTVVKSSETISGYEVLLATAAGGVVEIELAPDGKVLNVEEKAGRPGEMEEDESEEEDE